jgi:hypothetical protein
MPTAIVRIKRNKWSAWQLYSLSSPVSAEKNQR